MGNYPKRLIEVDLPIKRISAHARREKSIRHGHISTLHIWWARRPLAACRAVICASLWPDPADDLCPESFREVARKQIRGWIQNNLNLSGEESFQHFVAFQKNPDSLQDNVELRKALLDFIADFANWDNSTVKEYIETSCALTQAAHEALGGVPGTRPLVVDPFAGGGSIPLEALRVGADSFASDLNPVAVLLNKVVLEYIPKYGKRLAEEVRKWGKQVKDEAEKELAEFYPRDSDGATPIAYIWARTIRCEGPGCGVEVPLMRNLLLADSKKDSIALRLIPNSLDSTAIGIDIVQGAKSRIQSQGTIKQGSATCPICGYTTPIESVRNQLFERHGGTKDAKLMCVVTKPLAVQGKTFRLPTLIDMEASEKARFALEKLEKQGVSYPKELMDRTEPRRIPLPLYGMTTWDELFTWRQLLTPTVFGKVVSQVCLADQDEISIAVQLILSLSVSKLTDRNSSLCRWIHQNQSPGYTFARQALPMLWDFTETVPLHSGGGWAGIIEDTAQMIEAQYVNPHCGIAEYVSATEQSLPDSTADLFFTDPPYYYSIPYANLSDFFFVWLKRTVPSRFSRMFDSELVDKTHEIIQNLPHKEVAHLQKDRLHYENGMKKALLESARIIKSGGIGCVVFAHTDTEAWESLLSAVIESGWYITASWPIDTERGARMVAQRQRTLASSVHLVCRPRENHGILGLEKEVGDWRDVLQELPRRIHEWMPRLAEEGVVGADAIFACLGPALEVFSRYSHVEKASGEGVTLKEYLGAVWAVVAKEALSMIFEGVDVTGFEEDARLTAMWLWTLKTGKGNGAVQEEDDDTGDESEASSTKTKVPGGFTLEYDAARKIAQGLGAHLESLNHLVGIYGETAVLLPVVARSLYLFGKDSGDAPKKPLKKKAQQLTFDFVSDLKKIENETGDWTGDLKGKPGRTVLDQLHQSMILFAAGRTEALKRFLVEDGIGRNPLFWRLAQALSALYPSSTDEKRWVDGVLARKKGMGF